MSEETKEGVSSLPMVICDEQERVVQIIDVPNTDPRIALIEKLNPMLGDLRLHAKVA